jgi:hypothetical protein
MDETTDIESEFYKILAANDDLPQIAKRVEKDMYDASLGCQVGLTAAGNVAVVVVMSPTVAKMTLDAWDGIVDHDCESGNEHVMSQSYITWLLLQQIQPHLAEDVLAQQHFTHKDPTDG